MTKNNLLNILLGLGLILFYATESAALSPEECDRIRQQAIDGIKALSGQ